MADRAGGSDRHKRNAGPRDRIGNDQVSSEREYADVALAPVPVGLTGRALRSEPSHKRPDGDGRHWLPTFLSKQSMGTISGTPDKVPEIQQTACVR